MIIIYWDYSVIRLVPKLRGKTEWKNYKKVYKKYKII